MEIIVPTTITDAMLIYTDVPEADYPEYNPATTYGDGDTVMETASGIHRVYESLQAANTGNALPVPPATETAWWREVSRTNRWKCFDGIVGSQTSQATEINYRLEPGAIDSVAFLNMDADSLHYACYEPGTNLAAPGTFAVDTEGWAAYNGATVSRAPAGGGQLQVTHNGTNNPGAYKTFVTEASTTYRIEVNAIQGTENTYKVSAGSSGAGSTDLKTVTADAVNTVPVSELFTTGVGGTSTTITLQAMTTVNGDYMTFDDVVLEKMTDLGSETIALGAANPITQITDVARTSLTASATGVLYVTLTYAGGTAKLGGMIVGNVTAIGDTLKKPGISFTDFSTWTEGNPGEFSITAGPYSKKMNVHVKVANANIDGIARALAYYRATAAVYVAEDTYSSLIIYGFMKAFDCVFEEEDCWIYQARVEGKI